MKYSITIPSYDPELKNHDLFMSVLRSVDLNSKGYDYEIIIRKNGPSFVQSTNDAWASASGDYLISIQDDVIIDDPQWLEKLTDDTHFVTTKIGKFHLDGSDCPSFYMFGLKMTLFEKVGFLDTQFQDAVFYEDNDFIFRMNQLNIPSKAVDIKHTHIGGHTIDTYFANDKDTWSKTNQEIFYKKWGAKLHQDSQI